MLQANAISVLLSGVQILSDVSLDIAPGKLVAVLGPNGAGKSTLLAVLSGALAPNAGMALLDGQPLSAWTPSALATRRAVLQQYATLVFSFSALEVVLLGRSPHIRQSNRNWDLHLAYDCLAEMDVAHLANRDYTTLSGGEKQRVQMARVLAQLDLQNDTAAARYLLLDEPTNNLDLSHQHSILENARRCAGRGAGVLTVLHDVNLAAMYADSIVVLRQGTVAAFGAPEAVITEDILRETFDLDVSVTQHPNRKCPHVMVM